MTDQNEIYQWRINAFEDYPEPMPIGLILAEESGEVCRAILKRYQGIRGTEAHWTEQIKIETVQTLIALFVLAEREGFDLLEELDKYWPTIADRNYKNV